MYCGVHLSTLGWIRGRFPLGSSILELGSGDGTTGNLCRGYKLYSVEHNPEWVGRHLSNYIYAPIVKGWYSVSIRKSLPELYDLLIVDGPPGKLRKGIIRHFDMFRKDAIILVDDAERVWERDVISFLLGRGYSELASYRPAKRKHWVALKPGAKNP